MEAISDLPMHNDMDADYSPQYVKLARILRAKIESGQYKPGDDLHATELAKEYRSLHTGGAAFACDARRQQVRPSLRNVHLLQRDLANRPLNPIAPNALCLTLVTCAPDQTKRLGVANQYNRETGRGETGSRWPDPALVDWPARLQYLAYPEGSAQAHHSLSLRATSSGILDQRVPKRSIRS